MEQTMLKAMMMDGLHERLVLTMLMIVRDRAVKFWSCVPDSGLDLR